MSWLGLKKDGWWVEKTVMKLVPASAQGMAYGKVLHLALYLGMQLSLDSRLAPLMVDVLGQGSAPWMDSELGL